jgi:glycosyltransferase involved in cell wall biosynthesis
LARILYLIDGLPFGGAERQLSLLLKYLPPSWEKRVVSLSGGPYHQVLLDQKVPVRVYQRRSRFDLVPVFELYGDILRDRPTLIHSWGGLCSALVAPLCKLLNILLIDGSIRIANPVSRHSWRRRITFALSKHVVANSHAGIAAYRMPAGKSSAIYNAFDPDRLNLIKPKTDKQKGLTTVVMTGRISPFKDFASFFEAARRLSAQQPGCWKFVAVGAGDANDHRRLEDMASGLVAAGVVDLPDAGLEVLPCLNQANIGVLLSASCFKEGISNSIMEYMMCELPVICSDSGGNREIVADGETGFVIPSEDVDAFIAKLLFLRDHPDLAARMGRRGFQRVAALCSIGRMVGDYEALYTRLLRKDPERIPGGGRFKDADTGRQG